MPNWMGAVLAGAAAGALGAMGLGGGGVLLLWLAFSGMDQLAAQGVNLFFILPVGAAGLWLHRKNGLVAWRDGCRGRPFPSCWGCCWRWWRCGRAGGR